MKLVDALNAVRLETLGYCCADAIPDSAAESIATPRTMTANFRMIFPSLELLARNRSGTGPGALSCRSSPKREGRYVVPASLTQIVIARLTLLVVAVVAMVPIVQGTRAA